MESTQDNSFYLESRHVSRPIIWLCSGVGLAFLIYTVLHPFDRLGWIGIILALAVALNFYAIRISIDRETLLVSYGIGFIAREFDLHSITEMEMVDNYTFHAMYNPSAERVPRLHARDGRRVSLPINDARRLRDLLRLPHA